MTRGFIAALWLLGASPVALAQTPATPPAPAAGGAQLTTNPGDGRTPLQVSADNGVEWQKDTRLYIARGNAVATRGNLRVRADTLTAHYRDTANGKTEIFRVDAVGGVVLRQGDGTATGGQGIYDVDNKILRLTGGNLSYSANDSKITAQDSLEYSENKKVAIARGNAVAVRGADQVRADTLTGYYTDAAGGKRSFSRIDAVGNVVVSSNQNVAYAETATYDPNTKIANLAGKVRINRGADVLLGERAEVNMTTGTYKLLPGASGGRVTGVIQPDQKLDNAPGTTPAPSTPAVKPPAKPPAPVPAPRP
jgi:lipopolysaccharide export system protein LptA